MFVRRTISCFLLFSFGWSLIIAAGALQEVVYVFPRHIINLRVLADGKMREIWLGSVINHDYIQFVLGLVSDDGKIAREELVFALAA